ncbi:MAG: metallophosphoesterase [Myxococcales bacterium]|nr:metallophosphoesterase [Myxococcales bacterium]
MSGQTLRTVSSRLIVGLTVFATTLSACVEDGGGKPDDPSLLDLAVPADGKSDDDGGAVADLSATFPDLAGGPKTIRFVAMGDTGKGNTGQQQVAAAIAKKCESSGCDFIQLLGDNIYESGVTSVTDPQWQTKFEMPYASIKQPFYVVLGNHDYGGNGAGNEFGKAQWEILYTASSMKWKLPANHYRRTVENVDFFGLDTNLMMFGRDVDKQRDSLKNWLASSTATWKIALGHHPYLSNGPHGNAGSYDGLPGVPIVNGKGVKDFFDDNVCGKVDLYLSGHDHSRQWLVDTCKGTELAVSGAGASGTELKGKNPSRWQSIGIGFLYITISDRKLVAEFIDTSGKVEFTRTLTK